MKLDIPLEYNILEPKTKLEKQPLLILIHGYGADHNDLFSFAEYLNNKFYIVSLRAPHRLPFGGYAWYEINYNADSTKWTNVPQAIESRELIRESIITIQDTLKTAKDQTYLLGFSQGAILSYSLSLSYPEYFNKVIALSGYLDEQLIPNPINADQCKHLEFFMSHGIQDPVIPIAWARKTRDWLQSHNLNALFNEYNMGHGIDQDNFRDLILWLQQRNLI